MLLNPNTCVKVIHDAEDARKYPGIDTYEGRASPLIFGETLFSQSIEMPSGLVVNEHAEPDESMVYTIRGRWILSVNGQKHLMSPGSLHWIKEGAIAGCEVPFDEPALVFSFSRVKAAGDRMSELHDCDKGIRVVVRNGVGFT